MKSTIPKKLKVAKGSRAQLEDWVIERFQGEDAKKALAAHAEKLVLEAGITSPPVRLATIAKRIGIDPRPIYQPNALEGALAIIENKMRIVLRHKGKKPPSSESLDYKRMRFTYAHELAHSLFYDLKTSPPVRLAPEGTLQSEEQLCNRVASHLLMPNFMLHSFLSKGEKLSPELMTELSSEFQVSFQTIAYRIAESLGPKMEPNQVYLLSSNTTGIRGLGIQKPRCLLCILSESLVKQGLSFLQNYQGIDHIKLHFQDSESRWSLEKMFKKEVIGEDIQNHVIEETVICADGTIARLSSCHRRVLGGKFVWTEGTLRVLERPKKSLVGRQPSRS